MPTKAAKSSIQVIERMMSLLGALSVHATPVNQKHLSSILRRSGQGIRLLELGSLVKSRISVRQEALPHMQNLHQELGETVNLSIRN